MGKAIGIFFENGNVKAAEVYGSGRRMRISKVVAQALIADEEDSASASLREFFDSNKLARDNVVLCLSGRDSLLRRLKLPLSNLGQIRRTVKFQAEKYVVDRSLDDIVVDFFVIDRAKNETEIFLLAVKKDDLRLKLKMLKDAGVSPVGVTVGSVALFNLIAASGVLPREGSAALLEFSSETCRIILAVDRRLVFMRTLNISGMAPDALAERIARELRTSCMVAGISDPLKSIIVAGEGSEGTTYQMLARHLGADITSFNPFKAFPSDTTQEESSGSDDSASIALGAALKGIGAESVPVDFRREEFALRSGFDFMRAKLTYFFGLLVVLFGLLLAQSYYSAGQKQDYLDRIDEEARWYWKKIYPERDFPTNTFDKWIMSSTAKRKSDVKAGPQYRSMLESIRQIAAVLPQQQKATVSSISFDQKHVILAGIAQDFEGFETLVNSLRKLSGFKVKEKFEKRGRPGGEQRLLFNIELVSLGDGK